MSFYSLASETVAAADSAYGSGVNHWVIGGVWLGVCIVAMLILIGCGKGREDSGGPSEAAGASELWPGRSIPSITATSSPAARCRHGLDSTKSSSYPPAVRGKRMSATSHLRSTGI